MLPVLTPCSAVIEFKKQVRDIYKTLVAINSLSAHFLLSPQSGSK